MKTFTNKKTESGSPTNFLNTGKHNNQGREAPFFSRQTSAPAFIQPKLTVGLPGDKYEKEADEMANKVVQRMANPPIQAKCAHCEEEEKKENSIQRKCAECEKEDEQKIQPKTEASSFPLVSPHIESSLNISKGSGNPLPQNTRTQLENSFGADFSNVRLHTDTSSVQMNKDLHAQAFTHGSDIYFNAGKYNPESSSGRHLLAHELTHVMQQEGAGHHSLNCQIQRRLIVSGSTEALVNEYLGVVGTASGLRLNWTFATPRVTIGGNLPGVVPSPHARTDISRVINHRTQHAELHIGTNQPRVSVGAFPTAGVSTIQTIDMDDIRNLNASLPGQGTAKAFHEMMENFNAHGIGFGNFAPSHAVGVEEESNVLEDQGIVGRRLGGGLPSTVIAAPPGQPTGPNITYLRQLQNFTHYFLEMIQRRTTGSPTGPGADFEVVSARRIPKVQVSQRTIDSFVSGNVAVPPAGNVTLVTALADLNGNPNSTILIEGFADNVGSSESNITVSRNRAQSARAFFLANGIPDNRIAIVGRGETNFVASNANEVGRSQNRRIVLTVHRP